MRTVQLSKMVYGVIEHYMFFFVFFFWGGGEVFIFTRSEILVEASRSYLSSRNQSVLFQVAFGIFCFLRLLDFSMYSSLDVFRMFDLLFIISSSFASLCNSLYTIFYVFI